jgi:hypothetical protein
MFNPESGKRGGFSHDDSSLFELAGKLAIGEKAGGPGLAIRRLPPDALSWSSFVNL